MGCLIKLALALLLLLLGYGAYGVWVWSSNRAPVTLTCSQFI